MNQPSLQPQTAAPQAHKLEPPDIKEYGAPKQDGPQVSDKRLFFQLQVFTGCAHPEELSKALQKSSLESVLYLNVNDPRGVAVLAMSEDAGVFSGAFRDLLSREPFSSLKPCVEMTMFGRTYSSGREPDLEDWLLHKPRRNALNPDMKWAVWYPLRRKAEFELLPKDEQTKILYEHAKIGIGYGQAGFAHDIRLACHGLDKNDNEFVLGIVGPELYPLSRLVQDMRKTQQTGKYMQSMGPFFVGKVFYQTSIKSKS